MDIISSEQLRKLKKSYRLVTVKLQKKNQTDFAHFPRPGENDPYADPCVSANFSTWPSLVYLSQTISLFSGKQGNESLHLSLVVATEPVMSRGGMPCVGMWVSSWSWSWSSLSKGEVLCRHVSLISIMIFNIITINKFIITLIIFKLFSCDTMGKSYKRCAVMNAVT